MSGTEIIKQDTTTETDALRDRFQKAISAHSSFETDMHGEFLAELTAALKKTIEPAHTHKKPSFKRDKVEKSEAHNVGASTNNETSNSGDTLSESEVIRDSKGSSSGEENLSTSAEKAELESQQRAVEGGADAETEVPSENTDVVDKISEELVDKALREDEVEVIEENATSVFPQEYPHHKEDHFSLEDGIAKAQKGVEVEDASTKEQEENSLRKAHDGEKIPFKSEVNELEDKNLSQQDVENSIEKLNSDSAEKAGEKPQEIKKQDFEEGALKESTGPEEQVGKQSLSHESKKSISTSSQHKTEEQSDQDAFQDVTNGFSQKARTSAASVASTNLARRAVTEIGKMITAAVGEGGASPMSLQSVSEGGGSKGSQLQAFTDSRSGAEKSAKGKSSSSSKGEEKVTEKTYPRLAEKIEEVLKEVQKSKDGKTISLRLDPPSLGKVKIAVTTNDGVLHARFTAETPEAQKLLQQKGYDLQALLRKVGINFGDATVSFGGAFQQQEREIFGHHSGNNSNQWKRGSEEVLVEPGVVSGSAEYARTHAGSEHWVA